MQVQDIQFASRFNGLSGSAIREIFKLLARPGMISFAGGNPAFSALPDEEVARVAQKVLRDDGKRILQYGATEGYPPFRESLKEYIRTQFSVSASEPETLLRASLSALKDGRDGDVREVLWRAWATIACKAAVKLTTSLSEDEALALWRNLHACQKPFSCPHGRPTMLTMKNADLVKHFGRE